MSPTAFALLGLIPTLPLVIVFASIVFNLSAIERFMKSIFTSNGESLNLIGTIVINGGFLILPAALMVSLWPIIKKGKDEQRQWYRPNLIVAGIIALVMVPTWLALGQELYRCEILNIPNCD